MPTRSFRPFSLLKRLCSDHKRERRQRCSQRFIWMVGQAFWKRICPEAWYTLQWTMTTVRGCDSMHRLLHSYPTTVLCTNQSHKSNISHRMEETSVSFSLSLSLSTFLLSTWILPVVSSIQVLFTRSRSLSFALSLSLSLSRVLFFFSVHFRIVLLISFKTPFLAYTQSTHSQFLFSTLSSNPFVSHTCHSFQIAVRWWTYSIQSLLDDSYQSLISSLWWRLHPCWVLWQVRHGLLFYRYNDM